MIQHLDSRAPRVFVFIFQHIDEILDRFRIVDFYDQIDHFVLHVEFRVPEHAAEHFHIERAIHLAERYQARRADKLALVGQLLLQRLGDPRGVETSQQVDDLDARDRVVAVDAQKQIINRGIVHDLADNPEQPYACTSL